MKKPLLQVALDCLSLKEAFDVLEKVGNEVDIIEVGTILLVAEGKKAVSEIKTKYPNKIILADGKIADAGNILSPMLFEANADIVTVICCADIATIKGVVESAKKYHKEMQIELTGYWNFEQVTEWKNVGVEQVVYHRSRDAQAAGIQWSENDLNKIKKLVDLGFKVTITGGVSLTDLDLFKHLPIYIIIAGRAIRDTNNPKLSTIEFQKQLKEKWLENDFKK